jgi:hypothetical protein
MGPTLVTPGRPMRAAPHARAGAVEQAVLDDAWPSPSCALAASTTRCLSGPYICSASTCSTLQTHDIEVRVVPSDNEGDLICPLKSDAARRPSGAAAVRQSPSQYSLRFPSEWCHFMVGTIPSASVTDNQQN